MYHRSIYSQCQNRGNSRLVVDVYDFDIYYWNQIVNYYFWTDYYDRRLLLLFFILIFPLSVETEFPPQISYLIIKFRWGNREKIFSSRRIEEEEEEEVINTTVFFFRIETHFNACIRNYRLYEYNLTLNILLLFVWKNWKF